MFFMHRQATPDQQEMDRLQTINQVVDQLNGSERVRLLYLCESLETDTSSESLKEVLGRKVLYDDVTGQLLLRELMVRLRRFDILRKVCKTSRDEVEQTLSSRHFVSTFRVLMANTSEELTTEDLKSIKFLLSQDLPREKLEKSKSFLDVVIELEKLDMVSSQRVDLVEECLVGVSRLDLAKKVSAYKKSAGPQAASFEQNSRQQRTRTTPGPPLALSSQHQAAGPEQSSCSARTGNFKVTGSVPISASRGQSCQNQLDSYRFNSNPKGVCLIIDCVGHDTDLLEQTFRALHFHVFVRPWLSRDEILTVLKDTLKKRESMEGDAFICCIISRGTSTHLLGTDSHTAGLHMDSIRHQLTASECPALVGKPKLLFIQRYDVEEVQPRSWRDHRDEDLETDGLCNLIPEDADIFWSHCWTDEHQLEQQRHRSAYVKAVTDALLKGQRRKTHLTDLHTEVNAAIFQHNSQNPGVPYHIDLKHTLRKNLYL